MFDQGVKVNERGLHQREKTRLNAWSWGVLGISILLVPHLIGGIPPWATVAIAILGLLSALGTFYAVPKRYRVLPPIYWGLVLVAFWTWIQVVFLPCSWVQVLDVSVVEQARESWGLVSTAPLTLCALSIDPGNTRVELLKWLATCCFFIAGSLRVRSGERRALLSWIGLCGVGMVLSVCGHQLMSAQMVYGFYEPDSSQVSAALGPLLNENNLGGFLVLLSGAQIALALDSNAFPTRLAWAFAAVASLATSVLSGSRGAAGAACMLCMMVAIRPWLASKSRKGVHRTWLTWTKRSLLLAVVLGGLCFVVAQQLSVNSQMHDLGKLELWAKSWPVLMQRPILGIGRGAFSAAFTPWWGGVVRFTYIENLPLQWMTEWGVPVGGVLFTFVLIRIWTGIRRPRMKLRYIAASGGGAFLAQNLVDFSAELSGVAVVAAVVMPAFARSGRGQRSTRWGFRPEAVLVLMPLVLAIYGYGTLHHGSAQLAGVLRTADKKGDEGKFNNALRVGALLHPQEALLPYLAAARAVRLTHGNAAALINRSMVLAPDWVGPHVLAARMLWQMGRKGQAADELRRALSVRPSTARRAACALAKQDSAYVQRMIPSGAFRRRSIEMIASCLPRNHVSAGLLSRISMAEFPGEQAAFLREFARLWSRHDRDEAIALLEAEVTSSPCKTMLVRRLARYRTDIGNPDGALELVSATVERCGSDRELLSGRAIALAGLGQAALAHSAVKQLRGMAGGDRRKAAEALFTVAAVETALGEHRKALEAYKKAALVYGNSDAIWNAAKLSEKLGDFDQAERWWRRGCQSAPTHREYCQHLSELEKRRSKTVRDVVNGR